MKRITTNVTELTKKNIDLSFFGPLIPDIKILGNQLKSSYHQSLTDIYNISPLYCGIYFDYFLRKTLCDILNLPFTDMRAEHVIKYNNVSKNLINSYSHCKTNKTELCLSQLCDVMQFHSLAFNTTPNGQTINKIKTYILQNTTNTPFNMNNLLTDIIRNNTPDSTMRLSDSKVIINPDLGMIYRGVKIKGDADLIIGTTLYDIKCTRLNKKTYIVQLLAYMGLILMKYENIIIEKLCILNLYTCQTIYYDVRHIKKEMLFLYIDRMLEMLPNFNSTKL